MGAGGVKNFSVGICDGAPSTARSSYYYYHYWFLSRVYNIVSKLKKIVGSNNFSAFKIIH